METITVKREITSTIEAQISVPSFRKKDWGSKEMSEVLAIVTDGEKKVFINAYRSRDFIHITKKDAETASDYSLDGFDKAVEITEAEFWKIYRSIKKHL